LLVLEPAFRSHRIVMRHVRARGRWRHQHCALHRSKIEQPIRF
jgi:hypothetical protein